ncbi:MULTISPECIES: hypothetical protein [Salinicoccus]|uniref:Uncharacterized protein n=1 Tax=Salinicoccus sediminis TaxID=1432562 RepID=A0A0M2SIN5_9STAP|nr:MULTISPECIES: hypothetical protein [Salinicoccus]KKK34554.1 hypothetical protein WN59_07445 [Salinicoccus sediminis]
MFKFDKYTRAYHISNMIFYLFTLVVIGLIYVYGFYPPIAEVTSGDFFATFGLREFGGSLFFLVLIIVPLMVLFGAAYHLYKAAAFGKHPETAEN